MQKKVVVIGGGLGGMSAAISLRTAGFEVDLYEKNPHLGGKLNVLKTGGFSFDLGPSILTFPHIFEQIFAGAGREMDDYVQIVEPPVHWRCFFEDDDRIDLLKDIDAMPAANPSLGEDDMEELKRFLRYSGKLYHNVKAGYFDKGVDTLGEALRTHGLFKSLTGFDIFSTMHKGVSSRLKNRHLGHVMDFFVKYVGSSPYDAPAVLNMIPYAQFKFGLWYVRGGMYNLATGLQRLMEEIGVAVHLNSEIKELRKEGGKITAARTQTGDIAEGDIFVSNMEIIPAYRDLTGEDADFMARYEKFEPACSGLVIHLGVNKIYEQLAHHNFFFSGDPEKHFDDVFGKHRLPEDPTIYLVAPGRTDPAVAPDGYDNIKILPHIPCIQETPFTREEYSRLRGRVMEKLERMGLDGLRKNTVTEDIWTPEDIRDRYLSNRGAIYGVLSDKKKNLGFKAPKKSRRYENLYFTGGSINPGGGMPMVTLCGIQVANRITEDNA